MTGFHQELGMAHILRNYWLYGRALDPEADGGVWGQAGPLLAAVCLGALLFRGGVWAGRAGVRHFSMHYGLSVSPGYAAVHARLGRVAMLAGGLYGALVGWAALGVPGFWLLLLPAWAVALALVDGALLLLPDVLTLGGLWFGLAAAWAGFGLVGLHAAVAGALFGYLFLYALFLLYRVWRRCDGMGGGDFKLVAAIGAWVGPAPLAQVLLVACGAAVGYSLALRLVGRSADRLPFGPFLGFALSLYLASM